MKKTVFPLALILLSLLANAQSPYVSYEDSTHKGTLILNGLISKYILINDEKDFKWYINISFDGMLQSVKEFEKYNNHKSMFSLTGPSYFACNEKI